MKRAAALAVLLFLLTGCAGFEGQSAGGTDREWVDGHGRVCTAVKWGDAASVDCDFPPKETP